jgi:hypothetical protein
MSAIMERFSGMRGLKEGVTVGVGAALGVFLAKYLPTTGLIRALLGFAIVVLGAGVDGYLGDAVMGFGVVVLAQGVSHVSLATVQA